MMDDISNCVFLDKSLRTAAILVVKKWVPGETVYSTQVEQFACQHLDGLENTRPVTSIPSTDSQTTPESALEDEISRHLELYLALSSKKPELFPRYITNDDLYSLITGEIYFIRLGDSSRFIRSYMVSLSFIMVNLELFMSM